MTHSEKKILLAIVWVVMLSARSHGQAFCVSTGPEGAERHLVEMECAVDAPLAGDRQPSMLLDPGQSDALTANLESMTFQSKVFQAGPVTLTQGEYRASAAPESASEVVVRLTEKRAFGALSGKSVGVIVVVTTMDGTGTFYELALLIESARGWTNTDTVLLGDRVKVYSVAIERDCVAVAMTTHGPQDPMCCPTLEMIKYFAVRNDRLVTPGGKSD